jgi:UDPglucose 6-dehydrogenase
VRFADGADAVVVATEWPEFRALSPAVITSRMRGRLILDAGRFLDPAFAADERLVPDRSVGRASGGHA